MPEDKCSLKEEVQKRFEELKAEIQIHQSKLNQANSIAQQEAKQIIAKQGAVEVLDRLLTEAQKPKEPEKSQPPAPG